MSDIYLDLHNEAPTLNSLPLYGCYYRGGPYTSKRLKLGFTTHTHWAGSVQFLQLMALDMRPPTPRCSDLWLDLYGETPTLNSLPLYSGFYGEEANRGKKLKLKLHHIHWVESLRVFPEMANSMGHLWQKCQSSISIYMVKPQLWICYPIGRPYRRLYRMLATEKNYFMAAVRFEPTPSKRLVT